MVGASASAVHGSTPGLARSPGKRRGGRPRTTSVNPQTQLDQQPDPTLSDALVDAAMRLNGVERGPSRRAPPGTTGFHLAERQANGPLEAFLIDREFAHIHPGPDHSLHMVLPPAVKAAAIEGEWAEPHPMAGMPTVSPHTVLVYAPRNEQERGVVSALIESAWAYASGR